MNCSVCGQGIGPNGIDSDCRHLRPEPKPVYYRPVMSRFKSMGGELVWAASRFDGWDPNRVDGGINGLGPTKAVALLDLERKEAVRERYSLNTLFPDVDASRYQPPNHMPRFRCVMVPVEPEHEIQANKPEPPKKPKERHVLWKMDASKPWHDLDSGNQVIFRTSDGAAQLVMQGAAGHALPRWVQQYKVYAHKGGGYAWGDLDGLNSYRIRSIWRGDGDWDHVKHYPLTATDFRLHPPKEGFTLIWDGLCGS